MVLGSAATIMGTPILVVFDWDGTVVDSQRLIHKVMCTALSTHGHPVPSLESVCAVVGLELAEAITRLLPQEFSGDLGAVVSAYREAFALERSKPDCDEPLFPNVRETLSALAHADILCAIATGKSKRGLRAGLDRHELGGFFVSIQTSDDAPGKPHPGMLEQAMNEVGVDRKDTIMVGDTTFDMDMAANAGVRAVGVGWGYHSVEHLKSAGAVMILDRFSDIPDAVTRMVTPGARR